MNQLLKTHKHRHTHTGPREDTHIFIYQLLWFYKSIFLGRGNIFTCINVYNYWGGYFNLCELNDFYTQES